VFAHPGQWFFWPEALAATRRWGTPAHSFTGAAGLAGKLPGLNTVALPSKEWSFCTMNTTTLSRHSCSQALLQLLAVIVWDVRTGKALFSLKPNGKDDNGVVALSFNPNGSRPAGCTGGRVVVWDATTGKELLAWKNPQGPGLTVAFSPDGRYLASDQGFAGVTVRDATTGKEIHLLNGHGDMFTQVIFSPDSKHLASASCDQTVKLWDVATGKPILTLKGHKHFVTRIAFSPGGKKLASGSMRKRASAKDELRIWDTLTGKELASLEGEHDGQVTCLCFSPDGKRLASAGAASGVKVWEVVNLLAAKSAK
jgi:WD40 repeat protein